ncbi:MAG: SDR family NAD(P)-dependent oxidoreductase [Dehalococcoidia bacterium]|nr:MAG: SDR family NAD(P)-dependent oxidoreductase [bacterium]MCE7927780.1 SDR family NAD(P)-dependent oxidoreductase [Chloroflexi bacterium CFX7]MCK6563913.1 SDR family NAD(P)-dependent oxidoreductase [Dehalococcoidia bacterium]MCL4231099.1 SDR family NAD(P)-dependent oxidoreductase [Dehalococcoidia bacterium]NUQ54935.1 SDR family NAD(P)-dependent oxidoreductase [Dehalococcoidia bacterium]
MAQRLKGKVAVVTGAGRGIGRAEALLFAKEGARVVVNDPGVNPDGTGHDDGPAAKVVAEIKAAGGEAVANFDTVATMEGGENIVKTALDSFGRLDILVNNAGILRDRMVFNMTEEEWDAVIAVHLKGHFTTTRFATQVMRQQRSGRIINTSSESGLGNMGQANYSAAKEGIVGLTRTVARDMGKYGVTCNAIRPRAGTRLVLSPEMMEAAERAKAAGISGPQLDGMAELTPEQVAPLVVYLSTDDAAGVNGYDFLVGGGYISLMSQPEEIRTIWTSEGTWSVDEIARKFPNSLGRGLVNPAPIPAAQG